MSQLRINDTAPDFTAETTQGHHPLPRVDRRRLGHPVLAPEGLHPRLHHRARLHGGLEPEFTQAQHQDHRPQRRPGRDHEQWAKDIEETQGHAANYPMIGDPELQVAKLYDMLPAEDAGTSEGRTAADNATVRSVFVIGPDKKIKLMLTYPMTTGRNFDEILRVLDSMQLTAKHKVATPVNWKPGDDVIVAGVRLRRRRSEALPRGVQGAQAVPAARQAADDLSGSSEGTAERLEAKSLLLFATNWSVEASLRFAEEQSLLLHEPRHVVE